MLSFTAKRVYNQLEKYPTFRDYIGQIYAARASKGNKRKISGQNNIISHKLCILNNVTFDIIGDNNTVIIDKYTVLNNVHFHLAGNGHKVHIGESCKVTQSATIWIEDDNCSLYIGDKTFIIHAGIALTELNSKIHIGANCIFSYDIDIRCGDSHSIIDLETKKRINYAQDINIQDHIWVGAHVCILKGVTIGADSIVAAGSVVTKSADSNVVIAGNPAKVVRTGVTWEKDRIYDSE